MLLLATVSALWSKQLESCKPELFKFLQELSFFRNMEKKSHGKLHDIWDFCAILGFLARDISQSEPFLGTSVPWCLSKGVPGHRAPLGTAVLQLEGQRGTASWATVLRTEMRPMGRERIFLCSLFWSRSVSPS